MLRYLRKRKGQSTLEYAILIIIIIGALLSIQMYIRRGVQGRLRSASDDIGDQFSPGNTNYVQTISSSSKTLDEFGVDGAGITRSELVEEESTNIEMSQNILNVELEYWGD